MSFFHLRPPPPTHKKIPFRLGSIQNCLSVCGTYCATSSSPRISWLSTLGVWNCWDRDSRSRQCQKFRLLRPGYWHCKEILDCWDLDVEVVKIETFDWDLDVEIVKIEILIETMSKIETLRYQGSIKTWFCNCQEFLNCWDLGFETFKIECLLWDHVKNRDLKVSRLL